MVKKVQEESHEPKVVFWVAGSRDVVRSFPKRVRQTFGQAIFDAQSGGKHPDVKPLKGFGGAGVLEVIEEERGGTFRAVYTVKFEGAVYVLHASQKKSKQGIKTPPFELERIRKRLIEAGNHHAKWRAQQKPKSEIKDSFPR